MGPVSDSAYIINNMWHNKMINKSQTIINQLAAMRVGIAYH